MQGRGRAEQIQRTRGTKIQYMNDQDCKIRSGVQQYLLVLYVHNILYCTVHNISLNIYIYIFFFKQVELP